MKRTGPCYEFRGPHFQHDCTNNSRNKFQTKTPTQQAHKSNNYKDKFHNNKANNNNMFPMGTLSFQCPNQLHQVKICLYYGSHSV